MAKRVVKKPRTRKQRPMPWLEVIQRIRTDTEHDRHRLQILDKTPGWLEFASVWASQAKPFLMNAYPLTLEYDYEKHPNLARLHWWAWDGISTTGAIDAVLQSIDQMMVKSSSITCICFDNLSQNDLIYPDGTMNSHMLQWVQDEAMASQAAVTLRSNARVLKAIQTSAHLDRTTEKHTHRLSR